MEIRVCQNPGAMHESMLSDVHIGENTPPPPPFTIHVINVMFRQIILKYVYPLSYPPPPPQFGNPKLWQPLITSVEPFPFGNLTEIWKGSSTIEDQTRFTQSQDVYFAITKRFSIVQLCAVLSQTVNSSSIETT